MCNRIKIFVIVSSLLFLLPLISYGREMRTATQRHWEAGLEMGFTSDCYMLTPSVSYWGFPYGGVKFSIGFAEELEGFNPLVYYDYWNDNVDWEFAASEGDYHPRFISRFSLPLRYPRLFAFGDRDFSVAIQGEPGFILSPPGDGNKWAFWDLRLTIPVIFKERLIFSIGYMVTDYDLYSDIPNYDEYGRPLIYKGDKIFHGFTLGVSFTF